MAEHIIKKIVQKYREGKIYIRDRELLLPGQLGKFLYSNPIWGKGVCMCVHSLVSFKGTWTLQRAWVCENQCPHFFLDSRAGWIMKQVNNNLISK